MALTEREKKDLRDALADQEGSPSQLTEKLTAAVDATSAAAAVALLGTTTDISDSAGTFSNAAEPTGAEIDTTIDEATAKVEARLDDIEAKLDETLGALGAS